MAIRLAASTGNEDEIVTDEYPWSWPRPIPENSQVECELTRNTLRIAEAIAMKRFVYHPQREELVQDAVSHAWELSHQPTYRQRGTAGSIAAFAVKHVAVGRHFTQSQTSIDHPRPTGSDRPRRTGLFDHLTKDRTTNPSHSAEIRIDLQAWLDTLTPRQREVAHLLATGHTTREIAEQSGCTTNAVRMLRAVLRERYEEFVDAGSETLAAKPTQVRDSAESSWHAGVA
ncbi:MAG: sigma-70 family RNA polymerase sigma factor [Planctomycetaceae bacterium]|nr:sigma-70 family RNA polymerase sigma factor [Planctomycetaceae bacterium]